MCRLVHQLGNLSDRIDRRGLRSFVMLFFKDGQVLHGHREQEESHRADHQRDRDLSPLRNVVMTDPGFHARHGHIQTVGYKPENGGHSGKVQQVWIGSDPLEAKQEERNHKGQREFDPQEIRLIAGFEDHREYMTVYVILEPQKSDDP